MTMTEKVLHEVKLIETEDGFRFEIRGDKEKLREMIALRGGKPCGLGFGPGFAMGRPGGPFSRRRGGRGPRGMGYDLGPWWDTAPTEDEEGSLSSEEAPQT